MGLHRFSPLQDIPVLLVRLDGGFRQLKNENASLKRELTTMTQYCESLQKRVAELACPPFPPNRMIEPRFIKGPRLLSLSSIA